MPKPPRPRGVAFALLQRVVQGGVRLLPSLFELVDRHAKLPRQKLHGLAAE